LNSVRSGDNLENNINPDISAHAGPGEFVTLRNNALLDHQKRYIKKILDATGDLGNVFYDIMNKSTENDAARDAFQYLADMERHHIQVFKDLLAEVDKYQTVETPSGEYAAYLKTLVDSAVFTDDMVTSELATEADSDIEAMELAISAEKMDVSEELERLNSHLKQFKELLERDGQVGKEMDFLLQEMNREANTLATKMHTTLVVKEAIGLKSAIEKMREQVQNVE